MTNLEIVKQELILVSYDGHDFQKGKDIVSRLEFLFIDDLSDCITEIVNQHKDIFLKGFLSGINFAVCKKHEELMND